MPLGNATTCIGDQEAPLRPVWAGNLAGVGGARSGKKGERVRREGIERGVKGTVFPARAGQDQALGPLSHAAGHAARLGCPRSGGERSTRPAIAKTPPTLVPAYAGELRLAPSATPLRAALQGRRDLWYAACRSRGALCRPPPRSPPFGRIRGPGRDGGATAGCGRRPRKEGRLASIQAEEQDPLCHATSCPSCPSRRR